MPSRAQDSPVPNLEHLRKQAKRLLRLARSSDSGALARLRAHLPRLSGLGDEAVASAAKLADAQHVVALERGFAGWAPLRRHVESLEPLAAQVERFFDALGGGRLTAARRLIREHPEIVGESFHAACAIGDATVVGERLARDASLAMAPRGEERWTPLLDLCRSRFHTVDPRHAEGSLGCARLLLDHGADPNTFTLFDAADANSRIPALYWACMSDNVPVVRLLLERGADPNDGESIYHAAELERIQCLELLLEYGADPSGRHPHWGNTPLYFLSGYGELDANSASATRGMRWLLERGADPNVASGASRETPLHRIASGGRGAAVAEMLLAHGANPALPRADGRTALALAARAGNEPVAALLRARGATDTETRPVDVFLGACMRGDEAGARAVLAARPGLVGELTDEDRGMLFIAASEDRPDAVRAFVTFGFDVAWEGPDGGTPLHHAAWRGLVGMARLLIGLGAPVDARDRTYGSSPVGWAAHGSTYCRKADDDYCGVLEALLAAGASPERSVNRWGEGPAGMASRRVSRWLREHGFGGNGERRVAAE